MWGTPPRGLGSSYAWRPPGETSATVEELRTHGTVVLPGVEGLGVGGGGGMGWWAAPPPAYRAQSSLGTAAIRRLSRGS